MPTCRTREPARNRSWRRLATGSLCIAAASAALALAGPYALEPFVDAAGAATEVGVAFVLDFGGDRGQVVGCVHVPTSDNRYDALAAFTEQEHLAAPTYNDTGLLCSIGGIPVSGCGQQVGNRYIYWSYFTGPTTTDGPGPWSYSSTGAFAQVGACTPGPGGALVGCDVEGWRFQDPGTGLPNDPAPRTPADYAAICLSSVTTTTAPTTTSSTLRRTDPPDRWTDDHCRAVRPRDTERDRGDHDPAVRIGGHHDCSDDRGRPGRGAGHRYGPRGRHAHLDEHIAPPVRRRW